MASFLHNISPGTQTYTQVQKRSQTSLPFCIPLPVWIFNMENNISASSYLPFMMTCCVSVLLAFSPSLPRSLSLALSLHFTTCTNNIWHFAWSPRMWWLRPNDSAISPLPTMAATFLIDTDELCQRLQDSSVNKNFFFFCLCDKKIKGKYETNLNVWHELSAGKIFFSKCLKTQGRDIHSRV